MGELAARLALADLELVPEEDLRAFVAGRRWFGGKSQEIAHVRLVDMLPLPGGEPLLAVALAEVVHQTGTHGVYQMVLAVRPEGSGAPDAVIVRRGGEELIEALDDATCAGPLLRLIGAGATLEREGTVIRFVPAQPIAPADPPRPLGADQSNSSVVYGQTLLLKAYRGLEAGTNPELELLRFLGERGFPNVPRLFGWYEREGGPIEATLGVLQPYLLGARDGFALAVEALRFDPPALLPRLRRLGEVTGELHATLASDASDPRFAPEEPSAEAMALLAASLDEEVVALFSRLAEREDLAPLAERVEEVRGRLTAVEPHWELGRRIRLHGDYHLGQALWHEDDWVLIDFEGEPARPIGERRRKALPLRDVAGMLRSISYAAWFARIEHGADVPEALEEEARSAFLDAYLRVVEPLRLLPALRETTRHVLDLFELQKAVYELGYEIDHRPEWAAIPAAGIAALLGRREA